ncbi:MAG TPA: hypothetical protein VHZ55_20850 [Bryobacteraceae bacterium]|nr:hypothetical protein [Bryobacteraceae bacterium]
MRKFRCSSLSRCVVLAVAVLLGGVARADTINIFDVSGQTEGECPGGQAGPCKFSGMLTLDVTSGTVTGASISLMPPGLSLDQLTRSSARPATSDWSIIVNNDPKQAYVYMYFPTTKTPASLIGFDGSNTVSGYFAIAPSDFVISGGVITPSGTISPAPEPTTWILSAATLAYVLLRTRRNRSGAEKKKEARPCA